MSVVSIYCIFILFYGLDLMMVSLDHRTTAQSAITGWFLIEEPPSSQLVQQSYALDLVFFFFIAFFVTFDFIFGILLLHSSYSNLVAVAVSVEGCTDSRYYYD